ncbi:MULTISPECIES: isochorismatase family protein [Elizabethkingia]|uniref:isochorismatase family protein n=1 Tax=Elizabethkingia TaxID=308865 RepID=UPI000531FDF2|nr:MULTISPECIES: isochorismatase family protein [Elizabethkingia]KGT08769.1 isochorismatase [Elizabethkingia anophelis]MCL1675503.1 isochorismatase family protein [Elizabethkingia meningoseptica]MCL1687081.1 isochorismatase family protein [Elizabethkingia meningoseptica]MDV3568018.1 isochorismatase [Elizabethkingia anophelis]MDV3752479.1 isochorismatase [Elizabethkingia anophelis]
MKNFTKNDTIILLIDHQVGTLGWSVSRPKGMIISRTVALAKLGKALGIPIVLTSSQETQAQGLLLPELQEILPVEYAARIKREGITNAWNDENYKKAVLEAAGGRKNVIMAGLTHDVCIVFPSRSMVDEGFDVQVVIDAGGSPTQIADEIAQQTWEKGGVRTTTINQLVGELIDSWATEDGQKAVQIVYEEVMSKIGQF